MIENSSVSIQRRKDQLLIEIRSTWEEEPPMAAILNYSGEVIEDFELQPGANHITLRPYRSANYSIRVTNGKNVIVQKI
jgi:hypothetical protein